MLVLAIRRPDGSFITNPPPEATIAADPLVRELVDEHGAQIVPGSIRPTTDAPTPRSLAMDTTSAATSGSTTRVMPSPQLKTRTISSAETGPRRWISKKMAGVLKASRSMTASRWLGRTRATLPTMPPPVMWAIACTALG